jgi:hypothetical protein
MIPDAMKLWLMIAAPVVVLTLINRYLGIAAALVISGFFSIPFMLTYDLGDRMLGVGFVLFCGLSGILIARWLEKRVVSK